MDENKIPGADAHAFTHVFQDRSDPNVMWGCDERRELAHECQCYANVGDGDRPIYVKGVVATKHPRRAKKLAIRFESDVVLRWFEKSDVLRIVWKSTQLD